MTGFDVYETQANAMTALRARHIADAFTADADGWSPQQITTLVGALDHGQFLKPDGSVDDAKVRQLLAALDGVVKKTVNRGSGSDLWDRTHGQKPGTVANVIERRRASRGGQ